MILLDGRYHRRALRQWAAGPGRNWLYVAKVLIAMTMAYWLSMFLELSSTRSAALTVLIVMQPEAGQVFIKSVARIIGTLVGLAMSLTLVALFHQHPPLFMIAMAGWCGLCIAGAVRYRDMRSYACLLAGYTVGMIGVPGAINPEVAVSVSIGRMLAVVLGILCGGIVSALIFPGTTESSFKSLLSRRLHGLVEHSMRLLRNELTLAEYEQAHQHYAAMAVTTGAIRQAAGMENPRLRMQRQQFIRLNQMFMALGTRMHALGRAYLGWQHFAGHELLNEVFDKLAQPILGVMAEMEREQHLTSERATRYLRAIELAGVGTRLAIRENRQQLAHDPRIQALSPEQQRLLMDHLETLGELLYRFIDEFDRYCQAYADLASPKLAPENLLPLRWTFKTAVSPLYAATCGLRSMMVMLVVALMWYWSGWSNGVMFLQNAVIGATLSATSPAPHRMGVGLAQGAALGYVIGFFITFMLLPHVDGFPLMMLCVSPIFIIGTWLTLNPKWAGIGLGAMINFCFVSSPANPATFLPHQFGNNVIAGLLGMSITAALLSIMFPPSGRWLSASLINNLRRLVATSFNAPLKHLQLRIDSQCRDIFHQAYSITNGQGVVQKALLDWYGSVAGVCHAVIELRTLLSQQAPSHSPAHQKLWSQQLAQLKVQLIRLYISPQQANYQRAVAAVEETMAKVRSELEPEATPFDNAPMRQALSYLHFIWATILDPNGPFAAYQVPEQRPDPASLCA